MSEEIRVLAQVCSAEALARLNMEFRAIGYRFLTPQLEPKTSHGLMYRGLSAQEGNGHDVYGSLLDDQQHYRAKSSDLIHHCASFTDLWFFAQFPAYIPLSWYGKRVYGWKTCFCVGHPSQMVVPYLDCTDTPAFPRHSPPIRFHYLSTRYGKDDYSAMRIGL